MVKISQSELNSTAELYESFREGKPHNRLQVVRVPMPSVVAGIGHIDALDYTTSHGGKLALYRHEFARGSRPLFCVSPDGKQLLLIGGRYRFDDRGIVDKDSSGKDILNPSHVRNR